MLKCCSGHKVLHCAMSSRPLQKRTSNQISLPLEMVSPTIGPVASSTSLLKGCHQGPSKTGPEARSACRSEGCLPQQAQKPSLPAPGNFSLLHNRSSSKFMFVAACSLLFLLLVGEVYISIVAVWAGKRRGKKKKKNNILY